jgi:hypothetical protein
MNVSKKIGRVKQWAGEKMGAEAKTNVSDEFKALELEMALRHDGRSATLFYSSSLTSARYGEDAKVHDRLRQVPFEAQRN